MCHCNGHPHRHFGVWGQLLATPIERQLLHTHCCRRHLLQYNRTYLLRQCLLQHSAMHQWQELGSTQQQREGVYDWPGPWRDQTETELWPTSYTCTESLSRANCGQDFMSSTARMSAPQLFSSIVLSTFSYDGLDFPTKKDRIQSSIISSEK